MIFMDSKTKKKQFYYCLKYNQLILGYLVQLMSKLFQKVNFKLF